jgi:hypothetical protein
MQQKRQRTFLAKHSQTKQQQQKRMQNYKNLCRYRL